MQKLISVIILLALAVAGCKQSTEPTQPEQKPPGYQEDITWPSLADSPWPMANHDPQATSRSKYAGPISATKQWSFSRNNRGLYGSVSIGADSSIYLLTNSKEGNILMKLNPKGKVVDSVIVSPLFSEMYNTPLLTTDKIIITDGHSKVMAFDYNLNLKWEYETNVQLNFEAPAIDKKGNIYFNYYPNVLVALDKNGTLLWKLNDENFNPSGRFYSITISPDEKYLYLPGYRVNVIAVDLQNVKVLWKYGNHGGDKSIAIDNTGNIYFESELDSFKVEFVSVDKNGNKRWSYPLPTSSDNVNPTIDYQGNIYTGIDTLYSFDYSGKLRWKKDISGVIHAPLLSDKDGNVFFTSQSETDASVFLNKVDSNGNTIFSTKLNDSFISRVSLAMFFNDGILIPTETELSLVK